MRVLIGCEFSGIVRDAFIEAGHDAISCDLLPTERPGPHYQGNVLDIISDGFDMGIFFPPCTRLANSGVRWLHERNLWAELDEACAFFRTFLDADIPMVAVENPRPHKWATERIGRRFDFAIHPWEHGHRQKKTTCFWVRNLPYLMPTDIVGPPPKGEAAKEWEMIWRCPPGENQAKMRSRTFEGVAKAMAEQWE